MKKEKSIKNKKRLFVDMDGTLAVWQSAKSIEDCFVKGYFKDLTPQYSVLNAVKRFMKSNEDDLEVYVLSAVLDTPYAVPEKEDWLKKFIPEIKKENYIFVPYGKDKYEYIPGGVTRNDYLLDDYTTNLLPWHKAGGTGIKCRTNENHTNGTWKGPYIHTAFPSFVMDEVLNHIIFEGGSKFNEQ